MSDHRALIEQARALAEKVLPVGAEAPILPAEPLLELSFKYWQSILLAHDGAPMGLTLVEGVNLLSAYRDLAQFVARLANALEQVLTDTAPLDREVRQANSRASAAERRAAEQAEQTVAYYEALNWILEEHGWRATYYNTSPTPVVIDDKRDWSAPRAIPPSSELAQRLIFDRTALLARQAETAEALSRAEAEAHALRQHVEAGGNVPFPLYRRAVERAWGFRQRLYTADRRAAELQDVMDSVAVRTTARVVKERDALTRDLAAARGERDDAYRVIRKSLGVDSSPDGKLTDDERALFERVRVCLEPRR